MGNKPLGQECCLGKFLHQDLEYGILGETPAGENLHRDFKQETVSGPSDPQL